MAISRRGDGIRIDGGQRLWGDIEEELAVKPSDALMLAFILSCGWREVVVGSAKFMVAESWPVSMDV